MPLTQRERLIKKRQTVANRPLGRARYERQGGLFSRMPFLFEDSFEVSCQQSGIDAPQIETLTTGQDRHRDFANLGRREDELYMRWRLFQRLQESVERGLRQHMHFIDNKNAVARRSRLIAHGLDDFA